MNGDPSPSERLSDRSDVVLLLRRVVDQEGQIVQVEVQLVSDAPGVERWLRFRGAAGLLPAMQSAVSNGPGIRTG